MSEDVEDFEFTPKPEFEGKFTVFNEPDEVGHGCDFSAKVSLFKRFSVECDPPLFRSRARRKTTHHCDVQRGLLRLAVRRNAGLGARCQHDARDRVREGFAGRI